MHTLMPQVKTLMQEAPVVTEHFIELVRHGCMATNHLKWDKDGVYVPGCEERQLRPNFVQRVRFPIPPPLLMLFLDMHIPPALIFPLPATAHQRCEPSVFYATQSLAADVLPLELSSHSAKRGTLVMVPTGKEKTKYESGQSSFRILLGGYSSWEDKNIFG